MGNIGKKIISGYRNIIGIGDGLTKRAEVSWGEEGSVQVRCFEGNINVLEAAKLMEAVSDKFSIA